MSDITIREITATDKTRLLKIMIEFYNSPALLHHTPERVLSRVIDDCIGELPFLRGYVAVDAEDNILGYTMHAIGYSTEYGGINVSVEDLYVAPHARRRGIGKMLLDFADTAYPTAARIRLEVVPDNARAIELYKRCGYTVIDYVQMGKLPKNS